MGMDVYGTDPTSKKGEYFRANVWSWRPIWDITKVLAPDIIADEVYRAGQNNDGAGLDADGATKLGKRLREEWSWGRVQALIKDHESKRNAIPKETCETCGGTGRRAEPPKTGPGNYPCNGCRETGTCWPISTWYRVGPDHFQEWIGFVENCGGFKIN